MLSGLPVFALAEGAYPEFIFENETGFLMRTFKPEEQAEIVAQKLADAEQISKTGKQAKESMDKVYFRNVVRNENKKSHFVQSPAENNSRQQDYSGQRKSVKQNFVI